MDDEMDNLTGEILMRLYAISDLTKELFSYVDDQAALLEACRSNKVNPRKLRDLVTKLDVQMYAIEDNLPDLPRKTSDV